MVVENKIEREIRFNLNNLEGDYYFLHTNAEIKFSCTVKNISVTGVCITSKENIKKNEILFLHIKGNKEEAIKSRVVWKMNEQYGLQFLLDSTKDFQSVSYVMNHLAPGINNHS